MDPNYRQAGRSVRKGQIHHTRTAGQLGRTHPAATPLASATIPSKYETVLFGEPREREGFGSQASRFATEAVNENPGPGTYSTAVSSVLRDAPSIGKRGYGNGFASRTSRSKLPGAAAAATAPGPGAYEVQAYKATGTDVTSVTRPFAASKGGRAMRPDGADETVTPGPGTYNVGRLLDVHSPAEHFSAPAASGRVEAADAGAQRAYRSVFASQAPRFRAASASDASRPGPGAYDPRAIFGTVGPGANQSTGPSAAFRSGLSRTAPRNAAARPPPREDVLKIARSGAAVGVGGVVSEPPGAGGVRAAQESPGGPGPGAYGVGAGSELTRGAAGPSSAFREGLTDRFGQPTERRSRQPQTLPGPGSYDVLAAPDRGGSRTFPPAESGAPVSSAVFMSGTRRDAALGGGPRAPGPAYYHPSPSALVEKRSFHFNAAKRWTPL